MATTETNPQLGEQVREDAKRYVLHSWSVQDAINPIPVAGAEGRYFWDYEGKRYLDFASQLVNVSIGHQHPQLVAAIKEQADKLCTIGPPMATEPRSTLARLIAEVTPGDISMTFFTNGGAEANENAIKLARWYTGRQKIVARYRSYHGATAGAIDAHRRPAPLARRAVDPGRRAHVRPVHVPLPRRAPRPVPRLHGRAAPRGDPPVRGRAHRRRGDPRDGDRDERDHRPARRLPAVDPRGLRPARDPADRRRGDGRASAAPARGSRVDHWDVVPDILTMAKGINSGYVPLGAMAVREPIAAWVRDKYFAGGLTYSGHPLACASRRRFDRGVPRGGHRRARRRARAGVPREARRRSRPSTRRSARCAGSAASGGSSSSATARRASRSSRSTRGGEAAAPVARTGEGRARAGPLPHDPLERRHGLPAADDHPRRARRGDRDPRRRARDRRRVLRRLSSSSTSPRRLGRPGRSSSCPARGRPPRLVASPGVPDLSSQVTRWRQVRRAVPALRRGDGVAARDVPVPALPLQGRLLRGRDGDCRDPVGSRRAEARRTRPGAQAPARTASKRLERERLEQLEEAGLDPRSSELLGRALLARPRSTSPFPSRS